MSTKLEFDTPEGRLSLSIDDASFMAYDAGDLAINETRKLVERMHTMGLGELADCYARLLAQSKVTVMELREAREDAEMLLASGVPFEDTFSVRLEAMRETIASTQEGMRTTLDRMAGLSAACHQALNQIPGFRPPLGY